MKYFFALALGLFLAGFTVAVSTLKPSGRPGVTTIRWATDPNPARTVQVAEFERMHPDIHVEVDSGDNSRLVIQCATGVGPDVMDMSETTMQSMAEAGVLLDLTDLARAGGFSPEATYPAIRPALMVNGRQYSFPCNVYAPVILYNKRIFDDHHAPYPKPGWTWDDFTAAGRAVVASPGDSGKKHLGLVTLGAQGFFSDLLVSRGGRYFSADGRRCILDSPESLAAIRQYYDLMYRDGIIPPPSEAAALSGQGGWGAGAINWFSNGEAAMISIPRWYLVQLVNYPGLRESIAAVSEPRMPGQPSRVSAGARAATINARTRYPAAAAAFLSYLASPQYAAIIVHDGDALPPLPSAARDGQALVNGIIPDPAFQQVFVDAIKDAVPHELDPYIDAKLVDRWTTQRINEIENHVVGPEDGMRALTVEINRSIDLNLSRRPDLRAMAGQK